MVQLSVNGQRFEGTVVPVSVEKRGAGCGSQRSISVRVDESTGALVKN